MKERTLDFGESRYSAEFIKIQNHGKPTTEGRTEIRKAGFVIHAFLIHDPAETVKSCDPEPLGFIVDSVKSKRPFGIKPRKKVIDPKLEILLLVLGMRKYFL